MKIEMNEIEDGDGNEDIIKNEETPAASGSGTGLTLQNRTLNSQGSLGANIVAKSSKLRRKEDPDKKRRKEIEKKRQKKVVAL